jgi:hypothetical protein
MSDLSHRSLDAHTGPSASTLILAVLIPFIVMALLAAPLWLDFLRTGH